MKRARDVERHPATDESDSSESSHVLSIIGGTRGAAVMLGAHRIMGKKRIGTL